VCLCVYVSVCLHSVSVHVSPIEGEGEGEGAIVKTLSSSCEPPRAWARERRSKQASPHSVS